MKQIFEAGWLQANLLVHAVLLAGALLLAVIIVTSPDVLALAG